MATDGAPSSLDQLFDETRVERHGQRDDFDSLDTKAGVVLAFAGALGALAPAGGGPMVDVGRGTALLGVLLSLWSFWPRGYQVLDLDTLREKYLGAEAAFTRIRLLDTHLAMVRATRREIARKANRCRLAISALAAASILVGFGTALHWPG